jgi:EAL domain-containing protein (putative c-di-GMP-specific phosphodiesterase class I)
MVTEALNDTGLNPRYLTLELTEHIIMQTTEHTINTLKALKAIGVQISIDDFGTGYSSLNYLKRFPIDILKIDRSFVRDIAVSPYDKAIITAIIAMAHSLDLRVIAEGVETAEQLSFLHKHEIDGMQGYLLSTPLPTDSLTQFFHKTRILSQQLLASI